MQDLRFLTPAFNPQPLQACFCGSGQRFQDCCGSRDEQRPPPAGVHVVRDFVDAATCEQWVAHLQQQPGEATGTMREGQVRLNPARVTDRVFLGPVEAAVTARIRSAFTETIPAATGKRIEWFECPQILRYTEGHHYKLHADSEQYIKQQQAWQKVVDRDISLLLYLKEDFSGGALEFFAFHYRYQPRRGDLLFFPSDHRYAHKAHPVTSGERYVVVSWAAQQGLPKVKPQAPANAIPIAQK